MPCSLVVAVVTLAALGLLPGEAGERKRLWRREPFFSAPSPVFETMVTLVALSMRLSPIERDFVAAGLFALLSRILRPACKVPQFQEGRNPALLPYSKE